MRSNVELRVGVLVILAIAATTFWLLFLKEFKFKTATFPVHVNFHRVEGIGVGAPVHILGVERGKVAALRLEQDRVRLSLDIEEGTFIARDARFILQADFFNPTSIRVEQGQVSEAIEPGSEFWGFETLGLGQLMAESSQLLVTLNALASRADSLTADGRLDRMLGDLDASTRELKAFTTNGRREMSQAMALVGSLSEEIEGLVTEIRQPMGEALRGVGQASRRADSLMVTLEETSLALGRIAQGIESGQGTLGRLYESPALYDSLTQTVSRLDSLLDDVKENPRRYFNFELF